MNTGFEIKISREKKILGLAIENRVGRVSGNTVFGVFFWGLIKNHLIYWVESNIVSDAMMTILRTPNEADD